MKSVVLDTHTLVWFLQKDKALPSNVLKFILRDDILKVIPFIVICEVHYLHAHGRFPTSAQEVTLKIREAENFEVAPHTEEQLPHLLSDLGIHDALIVATALVHQEKGQEVIILSRDEAIKKHSSLPVIWDH